MAREGLRTLVVAKKVLTEEQYADFEVRCLFYIIMHMYVMCFIHALMYCVLYYSTLELKYKNKLLW